ADPGGGVHPYTYDLEIYSDAGYSVPLPGSPFLNATSPLSITGLSPSTTYYYKVTVNSPVCNTMTESSGGTLCGQPGEPTGPLTFTGNSGTGTTVCGYSAVGATGYVVVMSSGPLVGAPVNGQSLA